MEGTRHERVTVLITSYIIGFVTAYIAFGALHVQDADYGSFSNQTASVIQSTTPPTQDKDSHEVFVGEDDEGLVVIHNGERTLLSVKNTGDLPPQEGVYDPSIAYLLSPDKTKVYFCEQPTPDSDSCRPFIYSIENDRIYPVTIQGQKVAFPVGVQAVHWSEEGKLVIDEV